MRSDLPLERYSATVRILGDGVAVLDADGIVRSLNPAGEKLLGVKQEQIVGQRLLSVPWRTLNEDGSERAREDHPALIALRTGESQMDVRVGLIRPKGDVAWIAVTAVPLETGQTGAPLGVVVSFRDVTKRRATETALSESQRRLDLIFNATHDFIFLVAVEYPDGGPTTFRFETVNRAYLALSGRQATDMVGRTIDEALEPERAENVRSMLMRTLASGEVHLIGRNNFPRGVDISDIVLRVVDWADDKPSRILGVGRDITPQATSEAELRASEARFRTMAESMSEGVIITDLEDRALYLNESAADLTGYSREELLGQDLANLLLTPEGQRVVAERMAERTAGESDRYQVEMVTKDGDHRWIEIGGAPYRDAQGNVVGTVGIVTDVTDRRSIEQMKEEMVGVVSHEIRTPLASLAGSLKLLQREVTSDDSVAERLVGVAVRNAERLLRLVNDLLDLERLESAATPLDLGDADVKGLIDQTIDLMHPLASERGVRLVAEVDAACARADAERIGQVLTNLVGNAIKFSPHGGTVTIGAAACGAGVELSVRDQGRGIPADRLDALFRRFSQVHADDARKMKGAGLGLAISRAIVEQHGGRIWAANHPTGGAVFYFTLPGATA